MNLDTLADEFKNMVQSAFHVGWLSVLLTAVIILLLTMLADIIVKKALWRVLHLSQNPLPSSSIWVNIARVAVWAVGICIMLSSCFNVNISAAITALGVGGIAVSLGFQSTLSNLIGGLQISLAKLVEPGDNIKVGANVGIVHDVTWRHTVIVTAEGNRVLIPNSVINSDALIKMPQQNDIRINLLVEKAEGKTPEELADVITETVDKAVASAALLKKPSAISYFGSNDKGYKGTLYFSIGTGVHVSKVKDAAIKACKPYAHTISLSEGRPNVAEIIEARAQKKEHSAGPKPNAGNAEHHKASQKGIRGK